METGIQTDLPGEIDALHAQLAAEPAAESAETSGVETQPDPGGGAADCVSPNRDFCEEMLASALRFYSDRSREEFAASLAPVAAVAGREQIDRIAGRVAMSAETQAIIARHGANVLGKYGLARFVSDEALLVSAILAHAMSVRGAKRDRDELLRKFATANGAQGEPATGFGNVPHETKPGA